MMPDRFRSRLWAITGSVVLAVWSSLGWSDGQGEHWLDEMARIDLQIQLIQKRDQLRRMREETVSDLVETLPRVLAIVHFQDRRLAQLRMADGRLVTVSAGDLITPELSVREITARDVFVSPRQGARSAFPLAFETAPASEQLQGLSDARSTAMRVPEALMPPPPALGAGSTAPAAVRQP